MKHSRIRWTKELRGSGIQIKPVGFIHDEFQTEVVGTREEAEYVAEVQKQSIVDIGVELGFKCPLAGSGDIGKNWAETH